MIFSHVKADKSSFVQLAGNVQIPLRGEDIRRPFMATVAHRLLTNSQAIPRSSLDGLMASLARTVRVWRARRRDRRMFVTLDYRDLRDLGMSRWEVERELSKPFWRG
jgi:uncharacterized protein YjiS (DUF1127 family)